jgi:hypothetical protein
MYLCNKNASQKLRFFTILFNEANDIYVKICETSTLTSEMYFGLHFQFVGLIITREIPRTFSSEINIILEKT